MYDDTTRGLETPARDGESIVEKTDRPDCGRALADHGIASAGPGRTRLAPCGLDVSGVTLREVAFALDGGTRRVATDGGEDPLAEYDTNEVVAAIAAIENVGGEPTVATVRDVIEAVDEDVQDADETIDAAWNDAAETVAGGGSA
ncbi:hypothetical protein [Halobaculum magnesiiphilum]|uniref:Uncharacterized protein n=1 Tax=Halobaculum magnesiiphilum TaxID=1017351 RepID=A0A8T8WB49_9EURY|nr:hypothetical protein [Halobaculum magnesiiphilum]QZP37057.1 hypothetical protein K6T50_12255 [Halobaculum magnesiiphilum]